jgi:hypothetical protein
MDLNIYLPTGEIFASRSAAAQVLTSLRFSERNRFPASIWLLDANFAASAIPSPYTRIVLTTRPNDDFDNAELPFQAGTWVAAGTGATLHYESTIRTATIETARLFAPSAQAKYPLLLDIDLMVSADPEDGRKTLVSQWPCTINRAMWRGDEATPTSAVIPIPMVQYLDDRPEHKTDFFMFPGGVAPATGLYQAADANYTYTFKGGWTQWRRSAIASW